MTVNEIMSAAMTLWRSNQSPLTVVLLGVLYITFHPQIYDYESTG